MRVDKQQLWFPDRWDLGQDPPRERLGESTVARFNLGIQTQEDLEQMC